jgi:hypothetical protein
VSAACVAIQSRERQVEVGALDRLRAALAAGEGALDVDRALGVDLAALDRAERAILAAAITDIQVRSKLWLLDQLFELAPGGARTILVLGGWCGVLPWLAQLTGRGPAAAWISIDRDPKACAVGRRAFGAAAPHLSFVCHDIYELDYPRLVRARELIVINTICEHLHDFARWRSMLPEGVLTVLQSNDYRGCPDHVSCVDTTAELASRARLGQVFYQGSLALSLFTRFMVIGRT